MISAFTGTQVREAEQPLLDSGEGAVLMQRAAYGLAAAVVRELHSRGRRIYGSRVTVLAGKGNNGGDGLFAAARLAARGMRTTAVLTADSAHPEALAAFLAGGGRAYRLAADNVEDLAVLAAGDDVIIDAVLGTGARGGLRGTAAELVSLLEELKPALVVACDIPSGVDADSGEVHWPVLRAHVTVSFGGIKAGLLAEPGEGRAGRAELVRIGIEDRLPDASLRRLGAADLAAVLPAPGRRDHKYSRGVLGVVAGSERYPGAAMLAVESAAVSGAGMVRYLGPDNVARQVLARTPEAIVEPGSPGRVQAWLLGPGLAEDSASDADGRQLQRARDTLKAAFTAGQPAVVDAGALGLLPDRCPAHWILTPHAGELAAFLSRNESARGETAVTRDDVESRPLHFARLAAADSGATVLLKGATTLVASPSGTVFSQSEGTPWLATAGSGDVLAGLLGSLAAQYAQSAMDDDGPFAALGIPPEDRWAAAAAVAASLHGRAGSGASDGGPLTARAVLRELPRVLGSLRNGSPG
ncbi:NAD(P)H-hydrate epimerase [Arthrobacter silvisoli]|uniref:NAD(P)H-hydrate epimerase n=1 Tax=Arthrobacter silvisoli TaxID=2291022 RepID=UPI001B34A3F9|nr:NAD(P)H-hydrate epimerase [Arthrobacter silvisoli]